VEACLQAPHTAANTRLLSDVKSSGFICADRRTLRTYPEALDALKAAAFPEGVARVEKLAAELVAPTPRSIRRKVTRSDHGDEISMDRVWTGHLETAWTRAHRVATAGASRVAIGIQASDNSQISAEAIAWRGVAALALCDALEAAGYTVNLRAMVRAKYSYLGSDRGRYAVDVTIKADGTPLDVNAAANLVASTAMFRGACFRHIIVSAQAEITSGLGSNDFGAPEPLAGYDYNCEATTAIRDAKTAQAWIEAQINALDATHGADNH
jgi:hypothetical protein